MIAPIITLIPSITGITWLGAPFIRCNAISGDHDPKINPALYENPAALFLIMVGNRSEKNAGIGPDAVDMITAYDIVKKNSK